METQTKETWHEWSPIKRYLSRKRTSWRRWSERWKRVGILRLHQLREHLTWKQGSWIALKFILWRSWIIRIDSIHIYWIECFVHLHLCASVLMNPFKALFFVYFFFFEIALWLNFLHFEICIHNWFCFFGDSDLHRLFKLK